MGQNMKRAPIKVTEELHPTLNNTLWSRVELDAYSLRILKTYCYERLFDWLAEALK